MRGTKETLRTRENSFRSPCSNLPPLCVVVRRGGKSREIDHLLGVFGATAEAGISRSRIVRAGGAKRAGNRESNFTAPRRNREGKFRSGFAAKKAVISCPGSSPAGNGLRAQALSEGTVKPPAWSVRGAKKISDHCAAVGNSGLRFRRSFAASSS